MTEPPRGPARPAAVLADLVAHRETKLPSERRFGLTVGVVVLAIGVWPIVHGAPARVWAIALGIALAGLAVLYPRALALPNRLWSGLGLLLARVVSPIVAAVLFFGLLTPIAAILRLAGRDALRLRADGRTDTYWIERPRTKSSMRNQF